MTPSEQQLAIYNEISSSESNLLIEAVAGSGKTTTAINCLNLIPKSKRVLFLAFNKSIAAELAKRVPSNVSAKTLNSLGASMLYNQFGRQNLNPKKTKKIALETIGQREFTKHGESIIKLISICKSVGMSTSAQAGLLRNLNSNWHDLISRYNIETDNEVELINLARAVLAAGNDSCELDFDDQIYRCIIFDVPATCYDYVFVDEAQDLSPVQQELVRRVISTGRLVAVGDSNQAIYGFRGASPDSISQIKDLFSCKSLPLSMSYRCASSVVNYARKYVPCITSAPWAKAGTVATLLSVKPEDFKDGDLVICRNTAPIVSVAYRMMAARVRANVLGREIGLNLIRLIKSLKPEDLYSPNGLSAKVTAWCTLKTRQAENAGQPEKKQAYIDKLNCIILFIGNAKVRTVNGVINEINDMFQDETKSGVTLCTIHKSKGLEAKTVFFLDPDLCPSKYAIKDWEKAQEKNLLYVAITRAKENLFFIKSENFFNQLEK